MDLPAGTRLGPYAIKRKIGAGAMGVVYRADDPRLGRAVAIKVLPPSLRDHMDHLRRFEQEARVIGSLNHPNLLTVHDVGDHDGAPYFVTELLEGNSLRDYLDASKPSVKEALRIAAEIAQGLSAAHDAGIVHRDIKPENLFVMSSGRVKILDFGIAKLRRAANNDDRKSAVDLAHHPTESVTLGTGIGEMIGTPGYMAPEQLGGAAVDARTDLFALGVVLYEMLAGRRPFAGTGRIEEAYAIIKLDPEPIAGVPVSLSRVIMRCLEKRPEARFQSASDLAFALEAIDVSTEPVAKVSAPELEASITTVDLPKMAPAAVGGVKPAWLVVVAALAIVVGTLVAALIMRPAREHGAWPTLVEAGPRYHRVTFHSQSRWNGRFTPDGKGIYYSIDLAGHVQVFRGDLAHPSMVPVGVNGRLLDVSKKGELAVVDEPEPQAGGTLARAFPAGGARPVAEHVIEASWAPDGETLAIDRADEHGPRIEYPVGTTIVQRPSGSLRMLRVSPDGNAVAFRENKSSEDTRGRVVVVSRAGTPIAQSAEYADVEGLAWAPGGKEVWFSTGATIRAVSLGGDERELVHGAARLELYDVGPDEHLLVASDDIRFQMFVKHRGGAAVNISWFDGTNIESVSPDGHVMAFSEGLGTAQTEAGYALFTRKDNRAPAQLGYGYHAAMAPDAASVLVVTGATTPIARISTNADARQPIAMGKIAELDISDRIALSWSGKDLVVRGAEAGKPMQLWWIPLDAGREPKSLGRDAPHEKHPISPDGAWVALASQSGGVTLLSTRGEPERVLAGLAHEQPIAFSGDGSKLYTYFPQAGEVEIDEIDLATGSHAVWDMLHPEQMADYFQIAMDANGQMAVYTVMSTFADLYVLE